MVAASATVWLGLLLWPWWAPSQQPPRKPDTQRAAAQLVEAGIGFSHQGRFAEAAARFAEALRLDPGHSEAHYLLGLVRQQDGRPAAARESFQAALRHDPRFAPAQARLCELDTAAARARETGYEAALAVCRRAITLDARDPEPHLHAGWLMTRQGNLTGAIAEFQTALRLDPKSAEAKIELAMAHVDARRPEAAVPLLREVVQAEPDNGRAKFQLGSALAKLGDCSSAVPLLEQSTEGAQKHYLLANCYKKLGREADAAAAFERVKAARADADARMQAKYRAAVAQRKGEAGQWKEAAAEYRAALALTPDDAALRIDLAVALLKQGEAGAVLELLENDDSALAGYQRALALRKLDRLEEAKGTLERVLAARPGFVEAQYELGATLAALGDRAGAEARFQRAMELRPDDPALRKAWEAVRAR